MTTAQVTLETGLGLQHRGVGDRLQPLGMADFQSIVNDMKELLASSAQTPAPKSAPPTTSSATAG